MSVPHFELPFRFVGSPAKAAVDEQDSIEEIAGCVYAVMVCPLGFRAELPEFGIADPTFRQQPLDLEELAVPIELWEPRAQTILADVENADELVAEIGVQVSVRTEE